MLRAIEVLVIIMNVTNEKIIFKSITYPHYVKSRRWKTFYYSLITAPDVYLSSNFLKVVWTWVDAVYM